MIKYLSFIAAELKLGFRLDNMFKDFCINAKEWNLKNI